MPSIVAHALPQSVGGVSLTLVLTALVGLFLTVNGIATKHASTTVGHDPALSPLTPDDDRHDRSAPGRWLGLLGLLALVVLASFGPANPSENLADVFVLTWLWGVVGLSSLAVGSWWWRVDPLRSLTGVLSRAAGDPLQQDVRTLSGATATTAAVAGLIAWAVAQLLVDMTILTFQLLLIGYLAVHVTGAARYGVSWSRQAESLNVLSDSLGLLRPGGGGPLGRLTALEDGPRVRWISAVLVGWSLVDLMLETEWWHGLGLGSATEDWIGLVVLLAVVAGLYLLIDGVGRAIRLGPAFLAVAAGWFAAHYLSLLLVDFEPLPLGLLAALQLIPFVAAHLGASVVVQRRAARAVRRPSQLGPATFLAQTLIAVLLLGGTYLQLAGV